MSNKSKSTGVKPAQGGAGTVRVRTNGPNQEVISPTPFHINSPKKKMARVAFLLDQYNGNMGLHKCTDRVRLNPTEWTLTSLVRVPDSFLLTASPLEPLRIYDGSHGSRTSVTNAAGMTQVFRMRGLLAVISVHE